MADCWFEAYPKGVPGKIVIQQHRIDIIFRNGKRKSQRINNYVPSPELSSGNGTECRCIVHTRGSHSLYCLTRLHRFCGLSTNDYGRLGELRFRVELLRVHLAAIEPPGRHAFCLPDISLRYLTLSAALEYGSIIKLGQTHIKTSTQPTKSLLSLGIVREPGYEAYSVHASDGVIGMALIPNVETAAMLVRAFGGTAVDNVDAIEESDEEEMPWQCDGAPVTFACKYCTSFGKWIPVRKSESAVCCKKEVEACVKI